MVWRLTVIWGRILALWESTGCDCSLRHCPHKIWSAVDCSMNRMLVISLFHHVESSPFCNWYYLFTLSFLNKQTRHGRNIVSLYFFLFICGRAKCLSREQCVGSSAKETPCIQRAVCKFLELWPAALCEAGLSLFTKGSKIPSIELNTVHLC